MKKVHGIIYFDLLAVVHATKSALKVRKQGAYTVLWADTRDISAHWLQMIGS